MDWSGFGFLDFSWVRLWVKLGFVAFWFNFGNKVAILLKKKISGVWKNCSGQVLTDPSLCVTMGLRRPRFVEKTYETNCFSHSFNNNLMKRIYLPWTRICIWKKGWKWYALMHSAYNEMILKSIPKYISQYWVFV